VCINTIKVNATTTKVNTTTRMSKNVQAYDYTPHDLTIRQYPFSTIKHIDEVRKVVGELPEFAFRNRDGYIFCSYKRVTSETFPVVPHHKLDDPIHQEYLFRREIRGLAFDEKSGKIVGRCLHKFFNVGERPDSSIHVVQNLIENSIALKQTIYVMDKLDGSLVSPVFTPDNTRIRLRTKLGFNNDTSNACEKQIYGHNDVDSWPTVDYILDNYGNSENENERVLHFCAKWLLDGYTPMFEFYTKDTMIVIHYEKSFFTLIAMRETESGKYVSYPDMVKYATDANIAYVPAKDITPDKQSTVQEVIATVKKLQQQEGCVMRFHDGQMFKLKSDWYSDLHRIKQHLVYNAVNEGNVWALVFDDRVDDAIPLLSDDEQKAVKSFNDDLWKAVSDTAQRALEFCDKYTDLPQKEFAEIVKKETKNLMWAKILYCVRKADRSEAEDQIVSVLRILLFKDLNAARELLQAPHLYFFKNYMKNVREVNEDDL
jgi:RNA ligase